MIYLFTSIYHKNQANVGYVYIYIHMDPMGLGMVVELQYSSSFNRREPSFRYRKNIEVLFKDSFDKKIRCVTPCKKLMAGTLNKISRCLEDVFVFSLNWVIY